MNFQLDRKSKAETYIFITYSCYDGRLRLSTKIKTFTKEWNDQKQRIKGRTGEVKTKNAKLDFIQNAFFSVLDDFERAKIKPSKDVLKDALLIALGRKEKPVQARKITLVEFWRSFITDRERTGRYSDTTIKRYKLVLKKLDAYQAEKRVNIDFKDITHGFYDGFMSWLNSHKTINTPSSIAVYAKTLKAVMREAHKRKLHTNTDFQYFKTIEGKSEAIYLTSNDLYKLERCNVSERLQKVKDVFLIGCNTGLRFSDFTRIKKENIKTVQGVTLLSMVTQKTGERVEIPVKKSVLNILEKYQYKLPVISNQKTNKYLKELCKAARIDEKVTIQQKGKTITTEKYNLVSTHTARRSFATNAYLLGLPPIAIMKITGHKSESSFMKYIKVTKRQTAISLGKHEFFSQKRTQNVKLKRV